MQQILALDITGMPFGWISPAEAVIYYATNKVVWDLGEHEFTFRGGVSNDGIQSVIHGKSIIRLANLLAKITCYFMPVTVIHVPIVGMFLHTKSFPGITF
jgi:hypothetical protein